MGLSLPLSDTGEMILETRGRGIRGRALPGMSWFEERQRVAGSCFLRIPDRALPFLFFVRLLACFDRRRELILLSARDV